MRGASLGRMRVRRASCLTAGFEPPRCVEITRASAELPLTYPLTIEPEVFWRLGGPASERK